MLVWVVNLLLDSSLELALESSPLLIHSPNMAKDSCLGFFSFFICFFLNLILSTFVCWWWCSSLRKTMYPIMLIFFKLLFMILTCSKSLAVITHFYHLRSIGSLVPLLVSFLWFPSSSTTWFFFLKMHYVLVKKVELLAWCSCKDYGRSPCWALDLVSWCLALSHIESLSLNHTPAFRVSEASCEWVPFLEFAWHLGN